MISLIISIGILLAILIISFVVLYIVLKMNHKANQIKLDDIVKQSNDAMLSNFAGDKRVEKSLVVLDEQIPEITRKVNELNQKTSGVQNHIDTIHIDIKKYTDYTDTVTQEFQREIDNLPFEKQRQELENIKQQIEKNSIIITNLLHQNATQDVNIRKLQQDIVNKIKENQSLMTMYRTISANYVKKADIDQFTFKRDFDVFKVNMIRSIKLLQNTLTSNMGKYTTSLEYNIVQDDINAVLALLGKLAQRILFINETFATSGDLSKILAENNSLAKQVDSLESEVNALVDLVATIPVTYVSKQEAITLLQETSILNYAMIKFLSNNTINIDGTLSILPPGTAPQHRFHMIDSSSRWASSFENNNVYTYMADGDGRGLRVVTNNEDQNKFGLQVNNGSMILMQVNNNGDTQFGSQANANVIKATNELCIGGACITKSDIRKIHYLQYR